MSAAVCYGGRSWLLAQQLLLHVCMVPYTARARSARPAGRPAWLLSWSGTTLCFADGNSGLQLICGCLLMRLYRHYNQAMLACSQVALAAAYTCLTAKQAKLETLMAARQHCKP